MTRYVVGTHEACRIATGTYTGDGTVSQAISGFGFSPKFVLLARRHAAAYTGTDITAGFKIDTMNDNIATMGLLRYAYTDAIVTLDADGFTVDDNGSDRDPNKNGQVYVALVLG